MSQATMICQSLASLLAAVQSLRDPEQGCPWDKKQTMHTIANYTLEEVYELVSAIERDEAGEIMDELSDLLFHILLYAQIASEAGHFDFADILSYADDKIRRRHPHVFAEDTVSDEKEVAQKWQQMKHRERIAGGKEEQLLLDSVERNLPALQRAQQLQSRAAGVGFDWTESSDIFAKIEEELDELKQACKQYGDQSIAVAEEGGDLLFVVINLLRHCGHNSEQVLRATNSKFTSRFNYIEQQLRIRKSSLVAAKIEEMEDLWQQAKKMAQFGK